ncbi:MAG: hypothetical protein F4Y97_06755 [Dehalococcoidia bacterium]|nr:hypothetical protein [Dehalococcoidia bacterium]
MSEEPVIGGEDTPASGAEEQPKPVIGADEEAPAGDASEAELAEVLRETLLAAHDDLTADDLPGESAAEVRERYVAARERLEREAKGSPVPAGAPGRFAPAPTSAFEKIREGLTRLNA